MLSVPYALHAKTADSLTTPINETDPVYSSSVASGIISTDTTYWNNKSNFSGDYNSLINKPTAINNFIMDANAQNINNLANPINNQDTTTKAYVDMMMTIMDNNGLSVVNFISDTQIVDTSSFIFPIFLRLTQQAGYGILVMAIQVLSKIRLILMIQQDYILLALLHQMG